MAQSSGILPGMGPPQPVLRGEWAGAQSSKWLDRGSNQVQSRRIVDTYCRNGDDASVARLGLPQYFNDKSNMPPSESRRRLTQLQSEELHWRPARRVLDEPGAGHLEKREGKARICNPINSVPRRAERMHIRQHESKEELSDAPRGVRPVHDERTGLERRHLPAYEYALEDVITRKKRTEDPDVMRNGLPCRSLGDKSYRHPEYRPAFFKEGGLAIGSTFHRGSFPKTVARNTTGWKEFEAQRPDAVRRETYKQVMRNQRIEDERLQVREKMKYGAPKLGLANQGGAGLLEGLVAWETTKAEEGMIAMCDSVGKEGEQGTKFVEPDDEDWGYYD